MKSVNYVVVAVIAEIAMASVSHATLVRWTIQDGLLDDGGLVTGWVDYDADAPFGQRVPDWEMMSAGGDTAVFPDFIYDTSSSRAIQQTFGFTFEDPITSRILVLRAIDPLTNAGGSVPLARGSGNSRECFNCDPYRRFASGSLVGVPVPEPSSAVLVALGLSMLGFRSGGSASVCRLRRETNRVSC